MNVQLQHVGFSKVPKGVFKKQKKKSLKMQHSPVGCLGSQHGVEQAWALAHACLVSRT